MSSGRGHTCDLALLEQVDEAIPQANRTERNRAACASLWVVHDANALADAIVIADKSLDQLLRLIRAERAGLVPADGVVVHVDLAQALHHVDLVRRAIARVIGIVKATSLRVYVCVSMSAGVANHTHGKGKAVGDLQRLANVQPEELPSDQRGCAVGAVLHDFEQYLAIYLHHAQGGRGVGFLGDGCCKADGCAAVASHGVFFWLW